MGQQVRHRVNGAHLGVRSDDTVYWEDAQATPPLIVPALRRASSCSC